VQIRVLGPLLVSQGDASLVPTAAKPRSVLALFLLNLDQTVPVAALIKELWGTAPPGSALTTLQTYIVQLRKLFGAGLGMRTSQVAKTVLITTPGGYLLRSVSDASDLHWYEHLSAAGRRALAAGDDAAAADLLTRAQQLWRGPALADVRAGHLLKPQVKRLEESRLATVEQAIEARLRLGRHHEVLSELTAVTDEHRLHENLHAQFMVALHRSGRRQEALRVFQELRGRLREDLGLEPSKRLRLVQQAILADDPALDVAPRDDGLVQLLDQLSRDCRLRPAALDPPIAPARPSYPAGPDAVGYRLGTAGPVPPSAQHRDPPRFPR
jgi:DNA-binding SARP family transcriptional activator